MLALYTVNWILFIINLIVYYQYLDEDDVCSLLMLTLFGVGIPFNIYFILCALSKYEIISSYQCYMRDAMASRIDNIYLTFKQVKQFYIVNPKNWEMHADCLVYTTSDNARFVVLFRNPIDYYRTAHFFKNESENPKVAQMSVEDQNMKRFLECMRKDIEALNTQAEKEFDEALAQFEKINGTRFV